MGKPVHYPDGSVKMPDGKIIKPDEPMPGLDTRAVVGPTDDDVVVPDVRTTPIHSVSRVRANGSSVIVEGAVGGEKKQVAISRPDAIARARAINSMIPHMKYASDAKHMQKLVDQFVAAIRAAAKHEGKTYKSPSVSMYTMASKAEKQNAKLLNGNG